MTATRQTVWVAGILAALAASVPAAPGGTTVPLAPHGDAVDGSSGAPIALSPGSLVVGAEGMDGTAGTADDVVLLLTGLGGTPQVTPLAVAYGATYSSRLTRLSATRALAGTAGPDGVFGTADDTVVQLDRLGSENRVLSVVVGGLGDNQQYTPERLTSDRFAVASLGPDLTANTADDEIVIVEGAATAPVVKRHTVPFQRDSGRTHPSALSDSVLLVAGNGPDGKNSTADDVVHVLRGLDGSLEQFELPAPGLNRRAAGRPVRLTSRLALVIAAGDDLKDSTADDVVLLLDTEDRTVTPIGVPFVKNASAGRPTVLSPEVAVCTTNGDDGVEGTADDAVAILSGLGTTNDVAYVVVGATGDDNNCRPARLGSHSCALVSFGTDLSVGTSDDEVVVVSDIGGNPVATRIVVGAVASGTTSSVVPISATSLIVAGGGADGVVGTLDDAVVVVTGIDAVPSIARVAAGGAFDEANSFRYVAQVLGGGRAALLASGPDGALGVGGDDGVRVLTDLALGSALDVRSLRVEFARNLGGRPARTRVRARLLLDDPQELAGSDVTVSIGNAAQTIPASSFVVRHGVVRYTDPSNEHGFIRKFRFRPKDGRLLLIARGADDDLATTAAGYVPIGIEVGDELVPQAVVARTRGRRLVFKK